MDKPVRYQKKPVIIEAMKWTGDNLESILDWSGKDKIEKNPVPGEDSLVIATLEGDHLASLGDWIVKGVKGEFYPVKPDIFEMTYEVGSFQIQKGVTR